MRERTAQDPGVRAGGLTRLPAVWFVAHSFGGMIVPEGSGGAQAPSASDRGYMYIEGGGAAGGSKEVEISRAIAAGPRTVTDAARIVGADAHGNTIVLREGNDGFTCQLAIQKLSAARPHTRMEQRFNGVLVGFAHRSDAHHGNTVI